MRQAPFLLMIPTLLVLAALPALGQQVPLLERGADHERLDFLIGRWTVTTTRRLPFPVKMEGETVFRWDHGGAWLVREQIVELEGSGTIHNLMMMTHDPRAGHWNGVWWDNVSPKPVAFRARWRDERTLVFDSGEIDFGGRAHRSLATLTRVDDCHLRKEFRWSWDGGELQDVLLSELHKAECQ